MIAENAASKSKDQNSKRHQPVSANTFAKFNPAEKTLLSALVHVRLIMLTRNVAYRSRRFRGQDNMKISKLVNT